MPSPLDFLDGSFGWVLIRSVWGGDLAFDLMVSEKLFEGSVSSNLRRCPVHSQMLWGSAITCEILQCIASAFIVGLGNMTNGIKPQSVAENLTTNVACERFLLETEGVS